TWEALKQTLTGRGGAVVLEGALLNTNLTEQLFNGFAASPLVPPTVIANIKKKNPNLFGTNKTMFENLAGKIAIQDGKISTADLKLASNDFSMVGDGWFSFDKTLDLNTTLTLSQKLTNDLVAEVPAAKFLLNSNGRFEVPLKLTGAIMKPAVGVDSNALQARLQQGMVQQGRQEVQKKATDTVKGLLEGIGKKKEPPKTPPTEQPKTPPPPPADTTKAKG
ncbi:MAG TPA: AsmA-like C-terminal region-containing protein, partial [Candidatus Krumholzibacteria bacterium]|nr:AsmA-like C-terminal region-containing protein [Candidatus Krumholzibacteria bacterium]